MRPLLPPPGSALLVTSRETIPVPGMKRLTLEQLQPAEARDLLTGIAPRVPTDIADQICYLCGYLPLAVRAAASLLDVTADLDPAAYATQLADERTRLSRIGTEGVDLDVEASISLSYQRLTPDAARVFRQLSVFPSTFDAPAEETICQDPNHTHLSNLLRRNLVLYNPETARYRLHDLLRLYADARLTEDEGNAAQMHHAAHYLALLRGANDLYLQGGEAINRGMALFDIEWRNIQAGQSWADKHSVANQAAALLCDGYPSVGVHMLSLRQHPREQIRWLEAGLGAARQLESRASEAAHLGNLGVTYASIGEYRRAVEFFEEHLAIAREMKDRLGESLDLGNLGSVCGYLGETHRALEFHEQALAIDREIGNRRGEGIDLGNLGLTYRKLGETRRAIEFYEQALSVLREIGDRRQEGLLVGNLGGAYYYLGEMQHAVESFKQALIIARELGDRLGEGTALFNTGVALDELGDRAQAITHVEAALEILEQIESPVAAKARAQLAQWRGEE